MQLIQRQIPRVLFLQVSGLPKAALRGGKWPGNRYAPLRHGLRSQKRCRSRCSVVRARCVRVRIRACVGICGAGQGSKPRARVQCAFRCVRVSAFALGRGECGLKYSAARDRCIAVSTDFSSDRRHAGASVTSASLTDGIIASDRASFLTPFTKLCITPEGCSSFWFYELMGKENADRMLVKGEKVQLTPQWHMAALCLLAH